MLIDCFEFERINFKKCLNVEFRRCDILMCLKKFLFKLFFFRLGGSIRDVEFLDGDFRFFFIDEI